MTGAASAPDHNAVNTAGAGSAEGLEALLRRAGAAAAGEGPAPVERWNPPDCGDLDMRIAADGLWYYLGTPIGREPLVRLFASVLRRDEDGRYRLVTPVEKIGITVEDVPFVAVELHATGTGADQAITLRTNVGDIVEAGPAHPLRFEAEPDTDGVRPYVLVRGRLEARLARPLLYELVEHGGNELKDGEEWFGVWTRGVFFPMMRTAELERLSRR
jgi:hypothetical protein